MGEYAIRKSDGQRIKIGTCEDMYYLRYEDRDKVRPQLGNVDPTKQAELLRFRLPFPEEDAALPGEYEDPFRAARLYRSDTYGSYDFEGPNEPVGSFQMHHASGLLFSVPCHHGSKLPDLGPSVKPCWNAKSWSMELYQLRPTPEGVKPVVRCRHCHEAWRYDWAEIWEYVPADLKPAVRQYHEAESLQTSSS